MAKVCSMILQIASCCVIELLADLNLGSGKQLSMIAMLLYETVLTIPKHFYAVLILMSGYDSNVRILLKKLVLFANELEHWALPIE